MATIYTKRYKLPNGKMLRVRVAPSGYRATPRDWDTLGTLVLPPDLIYWVPSRPSSTSSDLILDYTVPKGEQPIEYMRNLIGETLGLNALDVVVYPITKCEFRNVYLSLGEPLSYDEEICGFIFTTTDKIKECYDIKQISPHTLAQVEKNLQGELNNLASWLNGEVYCYSIAQYVLGEYGAELEHEYLDVGDKVIGNLDRVDEIVHAKVRQIINASTGQ